MRLNQTFHEYPWCVVLQAVLMLALVSHWSLLKHLQSLPFGAGQWLYDKTPKISSKLVPCRFLCWKKCNCLKKHNNWNHAAITQPSSVLFWFHSSAKEISASRTSETSFFFFFKRKDNTKLCSFSWLRHRFTATPYSNSSLTHMEKPCILRTHINATYLEVREIKTFGARIFVEILQHLLQPLSKFWNLLHTNSKIKRPECDIVK